MFDRQHSTDAVVQLIVSFDFISVCTYGYTALITIWPIFAECSPSSVSFQHHVRRNKHRLWCNKCAV